MVTLWPIAEDAREALARGEHVLLKHPEGGGVVVAFEEHVDDSYVVNDWEIDNGWNQ